MKFHRNFPIHKKISIFAIIKFVKKKMEDNNQLIHNVSKTAIAQGTGEAVSNGFRILMNAIGIPQATIFTPLVRGATIGVMNTCYDDVTQRALSKMENEKVDIVTKTAIQTFMEFAEKDGVIAMNMQIEEGQLQYAYEVSEGLIMTAIRQSQKKKVEVLGRYYGKSFYKDKTDWQDMHQMISMVGNLTFRQIVMIRLISENFRDLDTKLFIHNPSACVEINRLKDYGIWQTSGAAFGINESWPLQLESIIPTDYSEKVNEALMLERLSEDDIKRTVESLWLSKEGTPERMLTEEEYKEFKRRTEWQELDRRGNIILDSGTY